MKTTESSSHGPGLALIYDCSKRIPTGFGFIFGPKVRADISPVRAAKRARAGYGVWKIECGLKVRTDHRKRFSVVIS